MDNCNHSYNILLYSCYAFALKHMTNLRCNNEFAHIIMHFNFGFNYLVKYIIYIIYYTLRL